MKFLHCRTHAEQRTPRTPSFVLERIRHNTWTLVSSRHELQTKWLEFAPEAFRKRLRCVCAGESDSDFASRHSHDASAQQPALARATFEHNFIPPHCQRDPGSIRARSHLPALHAKAQSALLALYRSLRSLARLRPESGLRGADGDGVMFVHILPAASWRLARTNVRPDICG